jgi:hypothetical protein
MAAGRPHGPVDPSVLSSIETALRPVHRPGLIERVWCWRWELGILASLGALTGLIAASVGIPGLIAAAGAGLAASIGLLCWPPARHRIIARFWCIVTPHRIRAGCINMWVQSRGGRLPVVLRCTPQYYGERVLVWLRTGLTAADVLAARDALAVACMAKEVRVIPDPSRAYLITLEVVRRPDMERTVPAIPGWPYSRPVEGDDPSADRDRTSLYA